MEQEKAKSLFIVGGFKVLHMWQLANPYWPPHPEYDSVRTPWWLVLTEHGPIEIGWRKRVIAISWERSTIGEAKLTDDDVTKEKFLIHAWSMTKALEYLQALHAAAETRRSIQGPTVTVHPQLVQAVRDADKDPSMFVYGGNIVDRRVETKVALADFVLDQIEGAK